ncbi:MAG: hypothetical protein U1F83_04215 [Verrucomicrobiota bacterium]
MPYVLMDKVAYSDVALAAKRRRSGDLYRVNFAAYGNDPAN